MSRNLRSHRQQTDRRLLFGFVLLLLIVGDGLIYLLYGREAALSGLLCLSFVLVPVGLIWAALAIMSLIVARARSAEDSEPK